MRVSTAVHKVQGKSKALTGPKRHMVKRKTIDLTSYNVGHLDLGDTRRMGRTHIRRIRYRCEARVIVPIEGRVLRTWTRCGVSCLLLQPSRPTLCSFLLDAEARLLEVADADGWLGAGAADELFQSTVRCNGRHGRVLLLQFVDAAGEGGPLAGLHDGQLVRGELVMAGLACWQSAGGVFGLQWEVPASGSGLMVVQEQGGPAFVLDDTEEVPQELQEPHEPAVPDVADVDTILDELRTELRQHVSGAAAAAQAAMGRLVELEAALQLLDTPSAGLAEACRASEALHQPGV